MNFRFMIAGCLVIVSIIPGGTSFAADDPPKSPTLRYDSQTDEESLHIEPNRSHQLNPIAFRNHTLAQLVIKRHASIR
jgi:hypothetical protein